MREVIKAVFVQTASILLALFLLILLAKLTTKGCSCKGETDCGCGGKKATTQPPTVPASRTNSIMTLALADPGLAINF